jgi:hypothetical protein
MCIVKVAMSKNRPFAQKEDVVNWTQDWINHEADWINHIWSVQSPEKYEPEIHCYYIK